MSHDTVTAPPDSTHTCPWWLAYSFDNPVRQLIHRPDRLLQAYLRTGDTAVDLGCGMGYFTMPMARLVGETGMVWAVDVQAAMLRRVQSRARHRNLEQRVRLHRCDQDRIALPVQADFILAFWMVHEVHNREHFLREVHDMLKSEGRLLIAEPVVHVRAANFNKTLKLALKAGYQVIARPHIAISRAVLLAI